MNKAQKAAAKLFAGHTPGPLRHDRDQPAGQRTNVIAPDGRIVVRFEAERMIGQDPYKEDVANAAFFRAANDPEIGLEASWKRIEELEAALQPKAKPAAEWHDDDGAVIWWKSPIEEEPYVGTPLDCEADGTPTFPEDYYTHWTPVVLPQHDDKGNIL